MSQYCGWIKVDYKRFLATYSISDSCLIITSDQHEFDNNKFEVIKATRPLSTKGVAIGDVIKLIIDRRLITKDELKRCPNDEYTYEYFTKFTVIQGPGNTEYHGWIIVDGLRFLASYRTSGDSSCGGYKLCLKINNAYDENKKEYVSSHSHFGDDKFEVISASMQISNNGIAVGDAIELAMTHRFLSSEKYGAFYGETILFTITQIGPW
jgi:hypothetical protein